MILNLEPVNSTLDYGCGKLRYSELILKTTDVLTIVDSEIQLSRVQKIGSKKTSIRQSIRASNRIDAYNTIEFSHQQTKFDRAFCINVLSVIPTRSVRARVIELIASKLKRGGTCLFVVQYRNSDFSRMRNLSNARVWGDGILIDSLRGHSFYGLIPPKDLMRLIRKAGLEIVEQKLNDGSVYLLAKATESSSKPKQFRIKEIPSFEIQ